MACKNGALLILTPFSPLCSNFLYGFGNARTRDPTTGGVSYLTRGLSGTPQLVASGLA